MKPFLTLITLTLLSFHLSAQHTIVLTNDQKIEGVVLSIEHDVLTLATNGEEEKIQMKEVSSIFFKEYVPYDGAFVKEGEEKVILTFKKGEFIAFNGIENAPKINIEKLNNIASAYAIGRDIHVGDTIVGTKGRVGFEAAAAIITIKAHHLLEKHTLTKWQLQHKEYLANWYGTHLHEGLFLDPVMRDLEAFLESSQTNVSGDVFITLKVDLGIKM